LPRYKITIEYDGSEFCGWQKQAGERTVQGEIEKALLEFDKGRIKVIGAGRTDAGVHALGQSAHFDLNIDIEPENLRTALNAKIPDDILIENICIVESNFNARKNAKWRKYFYIVAKYPTIIGRKYSWYPSFDYDSELLKGLSSEIVGRKDFAGFCKAKSLKENTICQVYFANWSENEAQQVFEIVADRFLHQMVRLLVGTMMDVARGRFRPSIVSEIIDCKNVRLCGTVAPPQGLFLVEVGY
jgi:tRNA pseudouridine38-40 synthase